MAKRLTEINDEMTRLWNKEMKNPTSRRYFSTIDGDKTPYNVNLGPAFFFRLFLGANSVGFKANDKMYVVETMVVMGANREDAAKWFDKYVDGNY